MLTDFAKKFFIWLCLGTGCLLLNSCFEVEQEFTLNPDGTGKVVLDSVFQNFALDGNSDQSEESLKRSIGTLIKDSEGVETWKDISYSWTDDGRIRFKGTAYFSDISELKFPNLGILQFAWTKDGDDGKLTVDFNESEEGKPKAEIAKDPEQRKKEMLVERQKFQQSKPMLMGFMTGLKHKAVFNLPGKAAATRNFTDEKSGKLGVEVTGDKLLAAMENLVADDEWLKSNSFDPQEGPSDVEAMSEVLFGQAGDVTAERIGLGKPLFDYTAEVAAARKDFVKIQEQFTSPIAPPAAGEAMKSLSIVGVQISEKVDEKLQLRPFNSEPGFCFAVIGEFPGSVLAVSEIVLEKAIADDGSDLLPEREWDRKASFPRLSESNTAVMFELKMAMPGSEVKSLKELSGTIQYTVSSGMKEVDLGLDSIKAGGRGREFGAEIVEVKDGWNDDGSKEIEIKLDLDSDTVKSLIMVDGTKRKELEKRGHSSMGNGPTTFNFESKSGFPENAKLLVMMHDGVETFDVPFKLENISLQGKPLSGK